MANYSNLKLRNVSDDYSERVIFTIDEDCSDDRMLLSLEITNNEGSDKEESQTIEYFSEKQILELYFFLKANLAEKYKKIL